MTVKDWLISHSQKLQETGIESARLDCLLMLENILAKDRTWILANQNHIIAPVETQKLKKLFKQRFQHIPMAYILGECEFYGRKFVVSPSVLQPRPESEAFFDLLPMALKYSNKALIADLGCGSGALGITAALEYPKSTVDLIDIDSKALEIAKINAKKFTTDVGIIKSDLLSNASKAYDVMLCNLPYVPDDYPVNQATTHEPAIALYGGSDGLAVYRKLADELEDVKKRPLYLLIESLELQHPEVAAIFRKLDYKLVKTSGLVQLFEFKSHYVI